MYSNCILWAIAEHRRLRKSGRGGPGDEIKWTGRCSRHEGGIVHVGILVDGIERSFKPVAPRRRACWEWPIVFKGEVVEGDAFVPLDLPPLPAWKERVCDGLRVALAFVGGWALVKMVAGA